MIAVKFSNSDEFLDELRTESGKVDGGIVRVCYRWRSSPPLTALAVMATAIISGRIVRLELPCGEFVMRDGPDGKAVRDRGSAAVAEISKAVVAMEMEVRPGVFEAA